MPSVKLSKLRKSFGGVVAVRDISVVFEEGKMTSVLGPSGCGKTTTLNLIAGFFEPDGGSIHFGDRPVADPARGIAVPCHRRNLGMVFQSYALWPHLSIGDNVAYGLKMHNVSRADRDAAVVRSLQRVRLDRHVDRYPHELSGGQQQRVALARAIAYNPEILLFDEPLSNLDAQLRDEMRVELKEIHQEVGVTAVYVTHDQSEAMALSDSIIVMSDGQILQSGTPWQLYEEPADPRVARFIGKSNVLDGEMVGLVDRWAQVRIEGVEQPIKCRTGTSNGGNPRGVLSIRPEAISLEAASGAQDGLVGRVSSAIYLGGASQYQVALRRNGTVLDVQQSHWGAFSVGDDVRVNIDPVRCYFIAGSPSAGAVH
jgi:ABC-type Fe3+/spermidine/putrescine transport system ATPase subunit